MNKWNGAIAAAGLVALIGAQVASAQTSISDTAAAPSAPDADVAPLETIPVPQAPPALPAASDSPRQSRIEEVIVTAQRKEERAQDVPISITVLSPEQLSNANVSTSSDLATYTPSLTTNQRFGPDNATFAIRGFTQDLRTTASVATYFAEVVAPRGQSSQTSGDGAGPGALFDLQNVQILKGPQGTLFGRNTTGGAVLLVPNKPSDYLEGYVELSGGNFDARREQAVVNVPVTDWFKLRAGIDHNQRDGYLHNITGIGADRLADTNYTAGRLSAVLNLGDDIENYTILSMVNSKTNGSSSALFACNPNPLPGNNPFYVFSGLPCAAQLARQKAAGEDGFYDIVSTIASPKTNIKERRVINTTTWQISDDLRLKNIVAYAHLNTENGSDIFGTQFHFLADLNRNREFKVGISVPSPGEPVTSQQTWVEELQLQGSAFENAVEWQAGAYYEHSKPDGYSGNNSAGLISCDLASIEGDPSQFNCFDVTAGLLGSVLVNKFKTDYLNEALYAQATYHVTDEFSLTGGIRYTWDKTKGYGIKDRYTFLLAVPMGSSETIQTPEAKSQAPTGLVELSYKPVDDVMAYAKYVRGYRQGNVVLASDPGIDTFKPERVNTYELGAKTTFHGPVPGRFNFAVFYNDLTNQQLQIGYVSPGSGPTTAIFNAGKSRIAGAEVESFFQFFDSLTLSLSYSYLNTKLIKQDDHTADILAAGGFVAGTFATPIADTGDSLPFAPVQSYVASLDYTLPFLSPRIGTIDIGATYVFTGKQRTAATSATPYDILDSFDLLNLNLNWTDIFQSSFNLSVFATNVLDEQYVTYASGSYNLLGFDSRAVGQPRMIGARLKYNFGAYAQR